MTRQPHTGVLRGTTRACWPAACRSLCCVVLAAVGLTACGDSRPDATVTARMADAPGQVSGGTVDHALGVLPADSAIVSLGTAGSSTGATYVGVRDTVELQGGTIVGRVEMAKLVAGDSAIIPTHDLQVCKPFTETRTPSEARGVGNAVVWLIGITTGPMPSAPRRASLTLDRCRLEPRVQRMALGGTLQVTSRDAMTSRLRFVDAGRESSVRTQVMLNDAGQVVPTADVASTSGLVEVRDDQHPWVRAYIAVASHPFLAVTEPNGAFRFDSVPPGTYTLVVWQEQLGVSTRAVRVTSGGVTRIELSLK